MAALTGFLLLSASVTGVKVKTHEIFVTIGSSVMFPGPNVKIDNYLILDLKKSGSNQDWLVNVHGGSQMNDRYATRGQYFQQNGSFLLSNLTEADSGVYELEVNLTLVMQITLVVIAPVKKPVFLNTHGPNKQCQMVLQCAGYGGSHLNVSILRNGEKIRWNITSTDNTTEVLLDLKDPQSWGDYVCRVQNPVSYETSNFIKLHSSDYTSCGKGILLQWSYYIFIPVCVLVFIIIFTCIAIISWNKGKKKTEHDLESPAENIELGILSSGPDSAIHYKANEETSEDPLLPADVPTSRGLGEDATAGNSARQISNTADSHSLGTELQVLNLLEESRVGSAGDPPATG